MMPMQEVRLARIEDGLANVKLNRTIAPASIGDASDIIIRDAVSNEVVACQVQMPELAKDARELARLLRFTKQGWSDPRGTLPKSERLSGIGSNNLMIGNISPNALYKRYAAKVAPVHIDNARTGQLFLDCAASMWQMFQDVLPVEAQRHAQLTTDALHNDWLLNGTPFSSGICNNSSVLPYHKDQGNIKDAWSMMLCLRNKMNGGALHLPEYGVSFAIADLSLLLFCGQKIVHGVTPLLPQSKEAYRFTIVFYTKTQLRKCGSAADEVKRAQIAATERIVT